MNDEARKVYLAAPAFSTAAISTAAEPTSSVASSTFAQSSEFQHLRHSALVLSG